MPFRLLPNSDDSRLKALQRATNTAEKTSTGEMPFPPDVLKDLIDTTGAFTKEMSERSAALRNQTESTLVKDKSAQNCQKYASHFIQVLNMAIDRKEISPADRAYFGLDVTQESVPTMKNEDDLRMWTLRVIDGEKKRIAAGGKALKNPSLSQVESAYSDFDKASDQSTVKKEVMTKEMKDVQNMRATVDRVIKTVWDYIEFKHREQDGPELRRNCRQWGLVYVSRPDEPAEEGVLPPDATVV